jgi:ADP-heptose:LPS heptosyltransferase
MKPRFRNLFYVSYGSIGDFLMTLNLAEDIHENDQRIGITVLATRNAAQLRDLAKCYSYITVRPIGRGHFIRTLFALLPSSCGRSIFVIPPTFGETPKLIYALGKILTIRSASKLIDFSMNPALVRPNKTLYFEKDKLFIENIRQILNVLSMHSSRTVSYRYRKNPAILASLKLQPGNYVVMAPYAANDQRSLPPSRWSTLLKHLKSEYTEPIILLGAPSDRDRAQSLIDASGVEAINACEGLAFGDIATVVDACKLFIGVDSGLSHLAGCLQKESVIIGNLSNPSWLPKYNPRAHILFNADNCTCMGDKGGDCIEVIDGRRYYRCMIQIPDEAIYSASRAALNL